MGLIGVIGVGLGRASGKSVIVTGGAAGIGEGIALLFAREGGRVMIADIDVDKGQAVVGRIREEGGVAEFLKVDVRIEAEVQHLIDITLGSFGRLDVLINNAGLGIGAKEIDTTEDEWDLIMDVNAKGTFLCTKHVIPAMKALGGGSIINIASLFALKGAPGFAAYAASKGAIRQLTKSTAVSHAKDGIRANAIFPGIIITPSVDVVVTSKGIDDNQFIGPIGHPGAPDDIAYGCLFLASDEAKFIVGAELAIDGGIAIQ